MSSEVFSFKQFSVRQDRCAMKVGTDGVLLGAWCRCMGDTDIQYREGFYTEPSLRILDIGAGTGLISLMLAQRYTTARIDAVEIDQDAASQCLDNFMLSPWSDRLSVHAVPLSQYHSDTCFELIVSNPPFYNATLKPEDEARAIARHKDSLPVEQIMRFASSHLTRNGILALVYPTAYDTEVMTSALLNGLTPSRLCDVITSVRKPSKRRLAEFTLSDSSYSLTAVSLLINSPEYKTLTSDFYL